MSGLRVGDVETCSIVGRIRPKFGLRARRLFRTLRASRCTRDVRIANQREGHEVNSSL